MAAWASHLMVAEKVMAALPWLDRRGFCVGNIAPDCDLESEDWSSFTPPREVTHWMTGKRKTAADAERFFEEYAKERLCESACAEEKAFLWGYYSHLVTDAECQKMIRSKERVEAAWDRIKANPELCERAKGMPENWDSIKLLFKKTDRYKDWHSIEHEYLSEHPDSGFITEIIGLRSFPDYLDFLPKGAIIRKVRVMGVLPEKGACRYPFVPISKDEYLAFIENAARLVINGISGRVIPSAT
ncbi:MAG: zinc dependent phospholipase C family protein [Eubacteriales bacterium]|nr:zinc dependent phospholipase C family protein [Eubacteriales bacterium]MDD3881305.1 zinc dependent phospholipase C family protein [Eubacteriales bacterium]MDD4512223.1 zinc dependent phospholipase C family protein [Eubacteriales bacterium]